MNNQRARGSVLRLAIVAVSWPLAIIAGAATGSRTLALAIVVGGLVIAVWLRLTMKR